MHLCLEFRYCLELGSVSCREYLWPRRAAVKGAKRSQTSYIPLTTAIPLTTYVGNRAMRGASATRNVFVGGKE